MSVIIDHSAIPCVYGLLPNKNRATYVSFFEAIRDSIDQNWNPVRIMSDFESVAISASAEVFPNCEVDVCITLGKRSIGL